jgi:hypothetical protein
VDVI